MSESHNRYKEIERFPFKVHVHTCARGHRIPYVAVERYLSEYDFFETVNNDKKFLNVYADGTLKEFDDLVMQRVAFWNLPNGVGRSVQEMFGPITCDCDSQGGVYDRRDIPTCPICFPQARDGILLKVPENYEVGKYYKIDLHHVTHTVWDSLSIGQKHEKIDYYINKTPH